MKELAEAAEDEVAGDSLKFERAVPIWWCVCGGP